MDLPPEWVRKYIGKEYPEPYACYLLVADILRNEFRYSEIPEFKEDYKDVTFRKRAAKISEILDGRTMKIERNEVNAGDIVVIQGGGYPVHVGVAVSKDYLIHAVKNINVCLEPIDRLFNLNRVYGFYRPCLKK